MPMNIRVLLLATLALILPALPLRAEGETFQPLPQVTLEGFTQTKAKSLDDYTGRALLIEFFAYW